MMLDVETVERLAASLAEQNALLGDDWEKADPVFSGKLAFMEPFIGKVVHVVIDGKYAFGVMTMLPGYSNPKSQSVVYISENQTDLTWNTLLELVRNPRVTSIHSAN